MPRFVQQAALAASLLLALPAADLAAQQQAADFRWSKAVASGGRVRLSNVNGDVRVTAAAGVEVEIIGRYRGSGRYGDDYRVEVVETSDGVRACVVRPGDECGERGHRARNRGWGDDDRPRGRVNLEVRVPRGRHVSAGSVSGDVVIDGAEGDISASSVSGDVHVERVRASSLTASSVSGDIEARVDALTGTGDLKFSSVSGDVLAELPKDFHADLRMSTVSGDLDSGFPITLQGRTSARSVEGRIGNGGRRLSVSTVSGDLTLRAKN